MTVGARESAWRGVPVSDFEKTVRREKRRIVEEEALSPHEPASDEAVAAFIATQQENVMKDNTLNTHQKKHLTGGWQRVSGVTEAFRRACTRVMSAVRDGSFRRRFLAVGLATGLVFGLGACSSGGDEPSGGFRTPPPPATAQPADTGEETPTAAPTDAGDLTQYGGVEPSAVEVPSSVTEQYGEQAANIARDALSAHVAGLGARDTLAPRVKVQRDYTAIQPFLTDEAWASIESQDAVAVDAEGNATSKGTRIVGSLFTVTEPDGTIPMPDSSRLLVEDSTYTLGEPRIYEVTPGSPLYVEGDVRVGVANTDKRRFRGTVDGVPAEVTYQVNTDVAMVPSADGKWLVDDARASVPEPVE